MKTTNQQEPSGKITASLVSLVGLALVWGIVWAHLPSKEELLSTPRAAVVPVVQELDLTIPGVPAALPAGTPKQEGAERSARPSELPAPETIDSLSIPSDGRTRQIAEVKCDAEVQQFCPDSLTRDDRRRCVTQRMKQLQPPCQKIVRQRMVRWKDVEGYKAACAEDVKRVCRGVKASDRRILQCLQKRAQDVSDGCYLRLPKGRLLSRN